MRRFAAVVLLSLATLPALRAKEAIKQPPAGTAPAPAAQEDQVSESFENTLLLTRVIEMIREQYVDEDKVSYKDLTHAALEGVLSSLDPHSQFLDEDTFRDMKRETKGEFTGLGVVVGMRDDRIIVIAPMEDTPGFRAGILPGDIILKIDDKPTDKMSLKEAVSLMQGEKGEKIKLTLLRKSRDDPKDQGEILPIELTRDVIRVTTVRDSKILPEEMTGKDKIGYIRLTQFGEKTDEEFEAALQDLEGQGMEALVVDLRNNPGGLLDAAVEVAGKFLPPGQVVVSTEGRTQEQSYEYRARGTKRHPDYPIAVLVNGYSASGSEIVAGALKDLGRAVLIGETTFGKGSVQSVQDLGNGIGLRLTTAKYYTPSHKVIHEHGVEPDILAPISEKEERALEWARRPQLLNEEQQREIRNLRDTQLERAVGALKSVRIFTQRQQTPPPQPAAKPDEQKQAANR